MKLFHLPPPGRTTPSACSTDIFAPKNSFIHILCHAVTIRVHNTQIVLRFGNTLFSGFLEPEDSLFIITGYVFALEIFPAEIGLCIGITKPSGFQ